MIKIYESREEAKEALRQYKERFDALQEEFGVWEENEDSCCNVWVYTRYYDKNGTIQTICD